METFTLKADIYDARTQRSRRHVVGKWFTRESALAAAHRNVAQYGSVDVYDAHGDLIARVDASGEHTFRRNRVLRRRLNSIPPTWEKWEKLMALAASGSGATQAERETAKKMADALEIKLKAAGIPKPAPKASGTGKGWGAWTSSKPSGSSYKPPPKPPPKAKAKTKTPHQGVNTATINWHKGVNGGWIGLDKSDGVTRWTIDYDPVGPLYKLSYRPAGAWGPWHHVKTYDTIFAAKAKAEKMKADGSTAGYTSTGGPGYSSGGTGKAPPPPQKPNLASLKPAAQTLAQAVQAILPPGSTLERTRVYTTGSGIQVQWKQGGKSNEEKVMFNRSRNGLRF